MKPQQPLPDDLTKVELATEEGVLYWQDSEGNRVSPTFTKHVDAFCWRESRGFGKEPISEAMKRVQRAQNNWMRKETIHGRGN